MKKLFLSMVLTLAMAVPAFAEVKDFKTFTADVPEGWQVVEEAGKVSLTSTAENSAITFMHAPLEGATGKQIADTFVQQLNAKDLKDEGDGVYTFNFDAGKGVISHCAVSTDDTTFLFISVTGESPAIAGIMSSLTPK